MAKVYITRCIVKKDGKQYKKGSVIEGLTPEEIKQGLSQHWLEAVGNNEGPTSNIVSNNNTEGTSKNRNKLLEKAKELGIPVKDSMTNAEIGQKIKDAIGKSKAPEKTRDELFAEAAALGIASLITEATTDEQIQTMIAEAQAQ